MKAIETIAIVGAGTMGAGIAQVCAQHGFKTLLFDLNSEMIDRARSGHRGSIESLVQKQKITVEQANSTLSNIQYVKSQDELTADLIIEAIIEKLEPKQQLFKKLAEINSSDCIFATNTSSIPVTKIASGIPHPERVAGFHFFNPAHIMKLVEVISGAATSEEVRDCLYQLAISLGKKPVLAADSPGFIVNRVARHYYVEALQLVEEGVADVETIDHIMEAMGFKMGPFRLMDLIGVDTNFSVTSAMYESFFYDAKFRPSRIQQQKVLAGHHGRKTGIGFYRYDR
jgi:3-hydroxybutyryl-CoA dehydrogenase